MRIPIILLFFNNTGVRCQQDTEVSVKKTARDKLSRVDDNRKKADSFLPSVIGLLTPDT